MYVCCRNVCRSLVAKAITSQLMQFYRMNGFLIESAGTMDIGKERCDATMQRIAAGYGYYYNDYSRYIRNVDISQYDLIITMDYEQKLLVESALPENSQTTVVLFNQICFGEDTPVEDYRSMPDASFRNIFAHIHQGCRLIVSQLREVERGDKDWNTWIESCTD